MKDSRVRQSGFYWVRFEGKVVVAEYTSYGRGCYPGQHWHVPASSGCYGNSEVCELLSQRLTAPGSLPPVAAKPMCTHAGVVSRDECPYCQNALTGTVNSESPDLENEKGGAK
jgi:hypothetical protein